MVARLNHNNTTMRTLRPLALLLVVAVAGTSPAAAASALSTTGPVHNSKYKSGRNCASTFDGCVKCKAAQDGGGAYTCTRCRPNSTFDDAKAACVCNSEGGYGTITKDVFDKWVAFNCKGKRYCKRPKWSTVAGECVKCLKYFGGIAVGGACDRFRLGELDFALTVANAIPLTPGFNPSYNKDWLVARIAPEGFAREGESGPFTWLEPGNRGNNYVTLQNHNSEAYDVYATIHVCSGEGVTWTRPTPGFPAIDDCPADRLTKYCLRGINRWDDLPWLDVSLYMNDCNRLLPPRPRQPAPWLDVSSYYLSLEDNAHVKLQEGQSVELDLGAITAVVTRRGDSPTAKDFVFTVTKVK